MMVRWHPFQSFERILQTWDPAQTIDRLLFQQWEAWFPVAGRGYPPLELVSTPEELVIRAEVPGISPEDLQVHVTEGEVRLQGTRRESTEATSGSECLYSERRVGSFQRVVSLPCPVDPAGARARYHSGVLEVRLPKKQTGSGAGRRLPIELQ